MNQEELKQRLIELIASKVCNRHVKDTCLTKWSDGCGECEHGRNFQIGDVADHLIANGVTIREHGEWTGMDGDICSRCGRPLSDIFDADSYYAIGFDIKEIVACPFCGADMRGMKDE